MSIEDKLQIACINWFRYQHPKYKLNLFHVPNGGNRSAREGAKFKRMGVVAGVADLLYLRDGFYYCIELKAPKGTHRKTQKEFAKAIGQEYYYLVRSLDEFMKVIELIHESR